MQILTGYMIFFMIGSSLSCYCPTIPSLEAEYCRSNLVIRGSAREENQENRIDQTYRIEVLEIYKAPSGVKVGDFLNGLTDITSCGGYLELNTDYVIAGTLDDNTYSFGACDYDMPVEYLNAKDANILKNGLKC